jgi:hypothetical protein
MDLEAALAVFMAAGNGGRGLERGCHGFRRIAAGTGSTGKGELL